MTDRATSCRPQNHHPEPNTVSSPEKPRMRSRVALLPLAALSVAGSVFGQRLAEFVPDVFPYDTYRTTAKASAADVDGDGFVDVLLGNRMLINDRHGRFPDATSPWLPSNLTFGWAEFLDVDLDGDLDLIAFAGTGLPVVTLFDNDGTRFVAAPPTALSYLGGIWSGARVFDADGSGALDVLVYGPSLVMLRGAGDGTLIDAGATGPHASANNVVDVIPWDFDHDGDLDVVATERSFLLSPTAQLWANDGAGHFTDASSRLPSIPYVLSAMATIDLDGDGFDELAGIADINQSSSDRNTPRVWFGDGAGGPITDRSTSVLPPGLPLASSTAAVDVDGDGRDELIIVPLAGETAPVALAAGPGALQVVATAFPHEPRPVVSLRPTDLDGDGDRDLLVSFAPSTDYPYRPTGWMRAGPSRFVPLETPAFPVPTRADDVAVVADFDGDGDLDVLTRVNDSFDPRWTLLRNGGLGSFEQSDDVVTPLTIGTQSRPPVADVDGDGDLDVLVGGTTSPILVNDGNGHFTAPSDRLGNFTTGAYTWLFIDADGDGDPDLFAENSSSAYLLVNDGTGHFTDESASRLIGAVPSSASGSAAALDIDGDGDLDIACSSSCAVYVNDGTGHFTNEGPYRLPCSEYARGAIPADLDGNGAPDLIVGTSLMLNNGFGYFTEVSGFYHTYTVFSSSYALGDMDADGDIDVVRLGSQPSIFFNDGNARFAEDTASITTPLYHQGYPLVGDFDDDGDPDVMTVRQRAEPVLVADPRGPRHRPTQAGQCDVDRRARRARPCRRTAGCLAVRRTRTRPRVPSGHRLAATPAVDRAGDSFHPDPGAERSRIGGTAGARDPGAAGRRSDHPGADRRSDRRHEPTDQCRAVDHPMTNAPLIRRRMRVPMTGLTVAMTLALSAAPSTAQSLFAPSSHSPIPAPTDEVRAATAADFDGDGRQDLFVLLGQSAYALYLRRDDRFAFDAPRALMTPGVSAYTACAGDVDGDGDVDVVLGKQGATQVLLVLRNDGSAGFTELATGAAGLGPGVSTWIDLLDADGDGDLDVMAGGPLLFLNDGTGVFSDATSTHVPTDLEFSTGIGCTLDVDGDGDLDLAAAITYPGSPNGGGLVVLLNDGAAHFSFEILRVAPASGIDPTGLCAGDVDGDGDPDVVVASDGDPDRIYENRGGYLVPMQGTGLPLAAMGSTAVAVTDLDGDGDLDLYFGTHDADDRFWRNDGTGAFTLETVDASERGPTLVQPAEVPGSTRHELFLAAYGWNDYLLDAGDRLVHATDGDPFGALGAFAGAHVRMELDLDGDGRNDLLLEFPSHQWNPLLGRGIAPPETGPSVPLGYYAEPFAPADVNGDGLDDFLTRTSGGMLTLWIAFPDHTIQAAPPGYFSPSAPFAQDAVWTDVDGDGDVDLVVAATSSSIVQLLINDGHGHLSDEAASRVPSTPRATLLRAADFDGDGDQDLIVRSTAGAVPVFWKNDGAGTFTDDTAGRFPAMATLGERSPLLDVDGDGDSDLLRDGVTGDPLLVNDGTGHFQTATLPGDPNELLDGGALDVDGDGDQDLWVATANGELLLFRRDASGLLAGESLRAVGVTAGSTRFTDFDGDGDPDLVGDDRQAFLLQNLTIQTRVPDVAIAGRTLRVRACLHPGWLTPGWYAATFFALDRAEVPLPPWGTVGLLPSLTVLLDQAALPAPDGVVEFTRPIPDDPVLIGNAFHLQSLMLNPATGEAHLTNVASHFVR